MQKKKKKEKNGNKISALLTTLMDSQACLEHQVRIFQERTLLVVGEASLGHKLQESWHTSLFAEAVPIAQNNPP